MTKEKIKILDKHYLTLYALMDSSFWFDTMILGQAIVNMEGSQVIIYKNKNSILSRLFGC